GGPTPAELREHPGDARPTPLRSCPRASTGLLPHGAVSEVGEWPVRADGARSAGPQGNRGGLLARFARAPSPLRGTPPAELGEKSRYKSPSPLRGTPPAELGEKSRYKSPSPLRSSPRASKGLLPHGAASEVGEWPVRAEGARSAGPQGNNGGFLARFARAPSPLRGTPPAELGEKSRGRRG